MNKLRDITPFTWKRLAFTILLITTAAGMRIWPLHELESTLAWLTFYPAVMIISIYGGLWSGLLATSFACITVNNLWFLIASQPFIKSHSDWIGVTVFACTGIMISCVSEAMRIANKKAIAAQKQAQNANLAKSTFLANMSHELRTPLNAILGFSELMQLDPSLQKKHYEYLQIINKSGEHLLALINEVLEISKIEAKRTTLEIVNFNIKNLILDIKKMFELNTNTNGILLNVMGVDELPRSIRADETKLRIILVNIIGNAVKFTQQGSIIVRCSVMKETDEKQFLLVEVEDTGLGISDDEKDKLFQYFMQTESGKISKSGTGLGLVISRDYARVMDGDITATSTLGVGSTFRIRVKIEIGQDEDQQEIMNNKKVIGIVPEQKSPRILVAEDNDANRFLLVTILESIGLDVRQAVNGAETITIYEQWNPDLIWMDIRMPEMDGIEATKQIKKMAQGKKCTIIALSAHVLGEERKEILAAGFDDFVGKPYRENELFNVMKKYLALEYIYKEDKKQITLLPTSFSLNLHLNNKDDTFCNELHSAAVNADAVKITALAEQIKSIDSALAFTLKLCATNLDYESIRIALEERINI